MVFLLKKESKKIFNSEIIKIYNLDLRYFCLCSSAGRALPWY
ncbi:MAG: hypothetical protein BAJALOKI3v1_880013 [Promethearchaeota archaeon]|nr:MAG: hypothetical protein BAJALOKI3v1_880013 [Candidatus Lokiarchaeota archaeon]